jgi:hypothetical protein
VIVNRIENDFAKNGFNVTVSFPNIPEGALDKNDIKCVLKQSKEILSSPATLMRKDIRITLNSSHTPTSIGYDKANEATVINLSRDGDCVTFPAADISKVAKRQTVVAFNSGNQEMIDLIDQAFTQLSVTPHQGVDKASLTQNCDKAAEALSVPDTAQIHYGSPSWKMK